MTSHNTPAAGRLTPAPPRRVMPPALPTNAPALPGSGNHQNHDAQLAELLTMASINGKDNESLSPNVHELPQSGTTPTTSPTPPSPYIPAAQSTEVFVSNAQVGVSVPAATAYRAEFPSENNLTAQRVSTDQTNSPGYNGFLPRPDRVAQHPTPANAQGLYPPDALIFVANLSTQRTEEQLERSCRDAFSIYGRCHVKVRHDRNKHPFAFVQFENKEDADNAVEGAANLVLDGRQIRIERAKAERAVILARIDGGSVSVEEARGLLEHFGAIEVCVPTNTVNAQHRAGTVYVKFAFWADGRDALRGFQAHPEYTLTLSRPTAQQNRLRWPPTPAANPATPRSPVDQRSIFIGNLPDGATREDLEALFQEFGRIMEINIIRKVFANDAINIFGFVEFQTVHDANTVVTADREFVLHGARLRVEPKEYSARRRRVSYSYPSNPVNVSVSNVTPRPFTQSTYRGYQHRPYGFSPRQFTPWSNDVYGHNLHFNQLSTPAIGVHAYAPNIHGSAFMTPPNTTHPGASSNTNMYSLSPFSQASSAVHYPNPIYNPGHYGIAPIRNTDEQY